MGVSHVHFSFYGVASGKCPTIHNNYQLAIIAIYILAIQLVQTCSFVYTRNNKFICKLKPGTGTIATYKSLTTANLCTYW